MAFIDLVYQVIQMKLNKAIEKKKSSQDKKKSNKLVRFL